MRLETKPNDLPTRCTAGQATHGDGSERRVFMRHPSTMPVACRRYGHAAAVPSRLRDVAFGGLSFVSRSVFAEGDMLDLTFPARMTTTHFDVVVAWHHDLSRGKAGRHAYGVRFCGLDAFMRVRVIEQICQIEAYRKTQAAQHSRRLSSNQAAAEWITRYAGSFPR